jgi:hypothetical protein
MPEVKLRNSYRYLFKKSETFPLLCEYTFSLMTFTVNNQEYFVAKSAVHSVNIRNKHLLHRQTANLSCFQKSAYYVGVNIFSNPPPNSKSLMNEKAQFKDI